MQKLKLLVGPAMLIWWICWGCRTMDQVHAPWFMYAAVGVVSGCIGWVVQRKVNGTVG